MQPVDKPQLDEIEFLSFPKMVSKASKQRAQYQQRSRKEDQWVVLEKLHGANFSFIMNGKEIRCAKRTSILGKSEKFYSHQIVRHRHKEDLPGVFERAKAAAEAATGWKCGLVFLYGELFGGIYPHPDAIDYGLVYGIIWRIPLTVARHIQKGVYYGSNVHFAAFDIVVSSFGNPNVTYVLGWDQLVEVLKPTNINHVPVFMEGNLEECLKFRIKDVNSLVPEQLGYPPLKSNQIEGVVIKAKIPTTDFEKRRIFKHKNPNFEEVNPRPQSMTRHQTERISKAACVELYYEEIELYINENRLDNVRSKIGEFTSKEVNIVGKLLFDDAMADFYDQEPEIWARVMDTDVTRVLVTTELKCRDFVTAWLRKQREEKQKKRITQLDARYAKEKEEEEKRKAEGKEGEQEGEPKLEMERKN